MCSLKWTKCLNGFCLCWWLGCEVGSLIQILFKFVPSLTAFDFKLSSIQCKILKYALNGEGWSTLLNFTGTCSYTCFVKFCALIILTPASSKDFLKCRRTHVLSLAYYLYEIEIRAKNNSLSCLSMWNSVWYFISFELGNVPLIMTTFPVKLNSLLDNVFPLPVVRI